MLMLQQVLMLLLHLHQVVLQQMLLLLHLHQVQIIFTGECFVSSDGPSSGEEEEEEGGEEEDVEALMSKGGVLLACHNSAMQPQETDGVVEHRHCWMRLQLLLLVRNVSVQRVKRRTSGLTNARWSRLDFNCVVI